MSIFAHEPPELWTDDETKYWLAFGQLQGRGLGHQRVRRLFEEARTLKPLWLASKSELKEIPWLAHDVIDDFVNQREKIDPDELLAKVKEADIQAYPLGHPLYPNDLRQIHDPPLVLYMKGELNTEDLLHGIGIVGTRRPTSYGQRLAKDFGRELARAGATIISGMAVGVDSLTHWGAIEGGGRTIAVVATGVDICYPSSNKPLYSKLVDGKHGAVVSEFFPGTKPEKWHFPARNRIISGLSQAVLVIEAGEQSGALITARLAFEQSRTVFSIPGRVDAPMSVGTNGLIAKDMAHLVATPKDVLDKLNWVPSNYRGQEVPTVVELFGREREVFELISSEPVHFDFLCEKSGLPAGELSATLTMLELAGIVARHPGDWYTREPVALAK